MIPSDEAKIAKFLETCEPEIVAAVKAGKLLCRVSEMGVGLAVPDARSGPALKRRLSKNHHVPVGLESGASDEELQKLEAELQAVQDVIAKHPLVGQAIDDGWIELTHHQGSLSFHIKRGAIPLGTPAAAVEKIAGLLGDYVKTAKAESAKLANDFVQYPTVESELSGVAPKMSTAEFQQRVAAATKRGDSAAVANLCTQFRNEHPVLAPASVSVGF